MRTKTKSQLIELIKKNQESKANELQKALGISSQALHRHLRELTAAGILKKLGSPPTTRYSVNDTSKIPFELRKTLRECSTIFSHHPAIKLVTLFGSQARGEATEKSDIDLLVWIDPKDGGFTRHDIWNYFDRQSRQLAGANKISLVVRSFSEEISIDTLLLDFPEEHIVVFDARHLFEELRQAVVQWRKKWGAKKIPSFGGTHSWKYSTKVKHLNEIDFRLELKNVA